MAFIRVGSDNSLIVEDCFKQKTVVNEIGGYWDAVRRVWLVTFTIENLSCLLDKLDNPTVSLDMEEKVKEQQERETKLDNLREMSKRDVPVSLRVPGLKGATLYNYQRIGIMYALTIGTGILLADDMGLGKSVQSIATAMFLKSQGLAKNALVVVPASLKFNWPLEIEKFTDEKYVVIDAVKPEDRIPQWLRNDVFFYVVNYELLLEDLFGGREYKPKKDETPEQKEKREQRIIKAAMRERILSPVRNRVWDFMVLDECHSIRHHGSKRSKNTKQLRSRFRMALTGTPMDGKLEELHSVMSFVAPGLLMNKTRFFQRYVETDFWGRVTGYKRISEISKKIQPFFLRRLKKDVLKDLPDKIYENRIVALTTEEMKIYKELAEHGHAATEDEQAMVAIIRCKQFCDWPAKVDNSCKSASKMNAFIDVLDEVVIRNGHKVLIFSQYKEMLNVICPELDKMHIKYLRIDGDTPPRDRADMQKMFNEDKSIDVMVGTEAMSAGLNLTGADYVVLYDQWWSNIMVAQAIDRAHRIGQKSVVTVITFTCKDTIEERIISVLRTKASITAKTLGDGCDEVVVRQIGTKQIAALL